MRTQEPRADAQLIRTSVLLREDTDQALRALAEKADRPLSREIRRAIEEYVDRETEAAA